MSQPITDVYLQTPDLSDEQILGYNVGIRPYRLSGIRLEREAWPNKIIIHNYGYGGSGLTLCWGGAQEVVRILQQEKIKNPDFSAAKNIAVLGAGVIGLATAYDLLTRGYHVTIYADKFSPHITSNVAAGIISSPIMHGEISLEQGKLIEKLLAISTQRYLASVNSTTPEFAGIRFLTDYYVDDPDVTASKFTSLSTEFQKVKMHFDNGVLKVGRQKHELGLDGKLFLDDLFAKVKAKGAVIQQKFFHEQSDINSLEEKIIINCTSMGSRNLFNDQKFFPVRGHLIYFQAQKGIDYSFHQDIPQEPNYWIKLYPWEDRLILGGVFENNVEDCAIDAKVVQKLLQYARHCWALNPVNKDKQ